MTESYLYAHGGDGHVRGHDHDHGHDHNRRDYLALGSADQYQVLTTPCDISLIGALGFICTIRFLKDFLTDSSTTSHFVIKI